MFNASMLFIVTKLIKIQECDSRLQQWHNRTIQKCNLQWTKTMSFVIDKKSARFAHNGKV